MTLTPGSALGPYEILSRAGAGGMGEVYKARDTRLERTVAIKVLSPDRSSDPAARQRFEREARAVAALSHPHICPLFDIGHQDGTDYLVMEYLEGETLAQRLARGALPLDQALPIAGHIADALSAAHKTGLVHRDLKPGNVMLTVGGAKLLDFGLAKAVDAPSGPFDSSTRDLLTVQGSVVGTLNYLAPEVLEGKAATASSDVFAFGALLYEMLTGERAFTGASQASIIAAVLMSEPPSLPKIAAMSGDVDVIVRRSLAKTPEDRYRDGTALREALERLASAPAITPVAAPRGGRRRRRLVISFSFSVSFALILMAVMLRQPALPPPAAAVSDGVVSTHPPDDGFATASPSLTEPPAFDASPVRGSARADTQARRGASAPQGATRPPAPLPARSPSTSAPGVPPVVPGPATSGTVEPRRAPRRAQESVSPVSDEEYASARIKALISDWCAAIAAGNLRALQAVGQCEGAELPVLQPLRCGRTLVLGSLDPVAGTATARVAVTRGSPESAAASEQATFVLARPLARSAWCVKSVTYAAQ